MTLVKCVSGCVNKRSMKNYCPADLYNHTVLCMLYVYMNVCCHMVCVEMRIMQGLIEEDIILGSAYGSCVKLFLFNKWILFFIFEGCSLCLCFHLKKKKSLRSPYLILGQNVSGVFHGAHLGSSVNNRTIYGIESFPKRGQEVIFLLDSPALPVCSCFSWKLE